MARYLQDPALQNSFAYGQPTGSYGGAQAPWNQYTPEQLEAIQRGQMEQAEYYNRMNLRRGAITTGAEAAGALYELKQELEPTTDEIWVQEELARLEETGARISPQVRQQITMIGAAGSKAQRDLTKNLQNIQATTGDRTSARTQMRTEREMRRAVGAAATEQSKAMTQASKEAQADYYARMDSLKAAAGVAEREDKGAKLRALQSGLSFGGSVLAATPGLTAEAKAEETAALGTLRTARTSKDVGEDIAAKMAKKTGLEARGERYERWTPERGGAAALPGQRVRARDRAAALDEEIKLLQERERALMADEVLRASTQAPPTTSVLGGGGPTQLLGPPTKPNTSG